jgi:hypothetical protein
MAACAPRLAGEVASRREVIQAGAARVELLSRPGDDGAARQVARAVAVALPRTARWGGLAVPVTITIHPTHAALEAVARRPGYAWLRAWARYGSIELQSPATWGYPGATDAQVVELLTHELTHCLMYQRAADERTWASRRIPLWFREGMASVTANQGARRGTLEDLRRFYDREPTEGGDPLDDPEPLYQGRFELVYGAAHHAFVFLLGRFGDQPVKETLARLRDGEEFPRAFEDSFGVSPARFGADFRASLPAPPGGQSSSGSLGRRTTEAVSQSRSP